MYSAKDTLKEALVIVFVANVEIDDIAVAQGPLERVEEVEGGQT